ncbi:MAG: NB-ARC domain-containing protein, partial [Actinomycetota bacterium]|nr:NB-ARC domain-containing protein [Actinomycetota bacterium]
LAQRAGLTAKAVSALERGERRRPYPHTVRSLSDALGLGEGERGALQAAIPRRGAETPVSSAAVPASVPEPTLPGPRTPLVGREQELEEIGLFLKDRGVRLLTLTGTGGVGKTRLALQAAREVAGHFPDGVVFVALASLGDPALVLPTIAQSLGLREAEHRTPREAIRVFLKDKKFLLVLDNLEHLLGVAPEVADLIEDRPGLCVFVTSRAPLRVRGEQEYPVGPLALPASTLSPAPEQVIDAPSGRLFVERATAASPNFSLTPQNSGAVAAICWRLDGLPLALELAAAKVRFLDPATLLSRLDRALSAGWARDLPERQRTMRAALDWSHDLLDGTQRELFARLSVFAGRFTLEAAEAVGASGGMPAEDVIYLLEGLVEQSLVTAGPDADGGGVRYGMLEPVRQYALERLEGCGDQETRGRHARYYLALAERAGPELRGSEQAIWLGRLETELDNLRAALSWAVGNGGGEEVARAAWTSWTYWWLSGHISEGRRWAEEALARDPGMPASARATLLFVAATLGQATSDFDGVRAMNDESMKIYRSLGDEVGFYYAMGTAGLIAVGQGRYAEGLSMMEESGVRRLEMGDKWPAAAMFGFSATVALGMGDRGRARRLAERSLSLGREIGAREAVSVALPTLATIARADGDYTLAGELFGEGLLFSAEVGDGTNVAYYLEGLATLAAEDAPERAARLWGAAEAILEGIEVIAYPHATDRSFNDRQLASARGSLDRRTWEEAWAEGRSMTTEEAVAYALERDEEPVPGPTGPGEAGDRDAARNL